MAAPAVDFDYLESFAAGDMSVVTEVLAIFQRQAEAWLTALDNPGVGWRDLVHLIKGSANGIGATGLGELAGRAEFADPAMAPQVKAALVEVLAEIEGYLTRIGGG